MRLRIRYTTWPRPAIELTDTPRPNCQICGGTGRDGSQECDCYDPSRARLLTPVPYWAARRWLGWSESALSDETSS